MKTLIIPVANKTNLIKVYNNSSQLYILSKIAKACNDDPDIPAVFWVSDNSLCYRPVTFPCDIDITAVFE